jgi:sulfite exporter TauE/SafE
MRDSAIQILPYSLLLLEVPLFALAALLSKRFIIGLWTIGLVYPFAVILTDRDMYTTKSFLMLVVGTGTIPTLIAAALLHFSSSSNTVSPGTENHGAKNDANG